MDESEASNLSSWTWAWYPRLPEKYSLMCSRLTPKSSVRKSTSRLTCSFVALRHSRQLQCSCSTLCPRHLGHFAGFRPIPPLWQSWQYHQLCLLLHGVGIESASMSKMSSAP